MDGIKISWCTFANIGLLLMSLSKNTFTLQMTKSTGYIVRNSIYLLLIAEMALPDLLIIKP